MFPLWDEVLRCKHCLKLPFIHPSQKHDFKPDLISQSKTEWATLDVKGKRHLLILGWQSSTLSSAPSSNISVCRMSRAASMDLWRQFLKSSDGWDCEERSGEWRSRRQTDPMDLKEKRSKSYLHTLLWDATQPTGFRTWTNICRFE